MFDSLRSASEKLRARAEEAAAARARVEVLLAGEDKGRAAANGPLAVFVLDKTGRIDGAAGAALMRLGMDPQQLTGRSIFDVCADQPAFANAIGNALAGNESAIRLDMADRVLETRTGPVRDRDGKPGGALSVWVDVTERERAAAQLQQVEDELRAALEEQARARVTAPATTPVDPSALSDDAIAAAAEERVRVWREVFEAELQAMAERVREAQAAADASKSATEEIERREEQLRAAVERESALAGQISSLKQQIEDLKGESAALAANRERTETEGRSLQELMRTAAAELAAVRAQAAAATRQADEARTRAQIATSEAASARIEVIQAGARMRAAVDDAAMVRGDMGRLQDAAAGAKAEAEAVHHAADAAASELEGARASIARMEEQVATLAADLASARDEAARAHETAGDLQRQLAEALEATAVARAEAETAASAEIAARRAADGSAAELEGVRQERDRLETDLRAVTQRLNVAVDEAARARTRAQDSEEHFQSATHDASAARAQVASMSREVDETRTLAEGARTEIVTARAERDAALTRLTVANEQLASDRSELVSIRIRAEEAEARIRAIETDAADARSGTGALSRQLEQAMAAIEAATAEATAARARAAEAERRVEVMASARATLAPASAPGSAPATAGRYDPVTELPDRAVLLARLSDAIGKTREVRAPLSVLIVDIDNFKDINDTFGLPTGDAILKETADRIRGCAREGDLVARLGGDEFAVILPATATDEAVGLARRILEVIDRPFRGGDQEFDIQASVGVAQYPEEGTTNDELIRRADMAMSVAKRSRGGYVVYSADDDERSPERLLLLGELRRAIARDELTLFWQPQVRFATGQIIGMEALVRWEHPRRGLLPPGSFIPLAERTGVIKPLHEWVLRAALRQCKSWSANWEKPIVAVNTSMPNVLDPRYIDLLQRMLREADVAAGSLRVEVTESVIMGDPELAKRVVSDLRTLGVQVSIDDFGTGYSSLGYLQQLAVNEIKIDKTFVIGVADDRSRAAIVRTTIDLGHHFGLEVVAEGVEDQRSWDILYTTACDSAQGYHISPPLPPSELMRSLTDRGWIRPGSDRGFRLTS
jgi:diguanylate cyclase (GGDEF)-like protein/PAS domain S-box-containing protein